MGVTLTLLHFGIYMCVALLLLPPLYGSQLYRFPKVAVVERLQGILALGV